MDGYGPDTQRDDVKRLAASLGVTIAADDWLHEIQSGGDDLTDRAAVTRILELAVTNPGAVFIFPRVDRMARLAEFILSLTRQLKIAGAVTHVVGVPGEPYTKEWMLMLTVLAGFAEVDYRRIVENLTDGKAKKHAAGGWAQGRAPYGYRIKRDEKGTGVGLEIVEGEATVIREAFRLGLTQGSLHSTMQLERLYGVRWSTVRVQSVWSCTTYRGERILTVGGQALSQVTPAIVDSATWHAVNTRWKARRRHRAGTNVDKLLAGFLRCEECGSGMCASKTARRRVEAYAYYRCVYGSKIGHHNIKNCSHSTSYNGRKLEPHAWELFAQAVTTPATLAAFVDQRPAQHDSDLETRRATLEAELVRAWEPFRAGKIPLEVAEILAAPVAAALAAVKAELATRFKTREAAPPPDLERFTRLAALALENARSLEEKRELLRSFNARFHVGRESVRLEVSVPFEPISYP